MKLRFIVMAVLVVLVFTGCADSNILEDNAAGVCDRELSGFWFGLWNGMTAAFAFIGSLFDSNIAVYDVCNNGGWYDFGFVLGAGILGGSTSSTSNRSRR